MVWYGRIRITKLGMHHTALFAHMQQSEMELQEHITRYGTMSEATHRGSRHGSVTGLCFGDREQPTAFNIHARCSWFRATVPLAHVLEINTHLLLACTQAWPPALPSGHLLAAAVVASARMWTCNQLQQICQGTNMLTMVSACIAMYSACGFI